MDVVSHWMCTRDVGSCIGNEPKKHNGQLFCVVLVHVQNPALNNLKSSMSSLCDCYKTFFVTSVYFDLQKKICFTDKIEAGLSLNPQKCNISATFFNHYFKGSVMILWPIKGLDEFVASSKCVKCNSSIYELSTLPLNQQPE